MRYFAKATTPHRLCGNKIRPPLTTISKAICFCPETIAYGGLMAGFMPVSRRSYIGFISVLWKIGSYAGLTVVLFWSHGGFMAVLW